MTKRVTLDRAVWACWWIGTILIVLAWFSLVPVLVGWIGFGIAAVAVVVSVVANRYWRIPPADNPKKYPEHPSESGQGNPGKSK